MRHGFNIVRRACAVLMLAALASTAAAQTPVEKSTPPQTMLAAQVVQGDTKRTRPLCVCPQVAKWNGTGSQDNAANFSCRQP